VRIQSVYIHPVQIKAIRSQTDSDKPPIQVEGNTNMKNQNPARQALAEGAIHTFRDKLFPKPKERYARILV
jgi:hypothetical protein